MSSTLTTTTITATMAATTLPRPSLAPSSLPPFDPPTAALPPLPKVHKTRKSLALSTRLPSASLTPSKLAVRATSRPSLPPSPTKSPAASTPSIPVPKSFASSKALASGSDKTLRKTVSISAFPQPPKVSARSSALSSRPSLPGSSSMPDNSRRGSAETPGKMPAGGLRLKKQRTSTSNSTLQKAYAGANSPSLLNGSGDGVSISAGTGQRGSVGLLSLPSPPHSRSSSAQGSYSTTATTFEDVDGEGAAGREHHAEARADKRRSSEKESKGNVIVSVRVRPDDAKGDGRSEGEWMVDGRRSLVAFKGREGGDYYYDNVFAAHDNNYKVYDASAKRLVRRVMEGYHGTVFAYGMTGTGKTFSMQGTTASPGVIPLAITDIFSYIRETPHREFLLRVSYLEIYNEKIFDLLSPAATAGSGPQEEIKLREDAKRGIYATPLKEEIVQSPTQLLRVIGRGDHVRKTGSTQFNAHSSRSHAVVQIVVESRERAPTDASGLEDKRAALAPSGVRVSTLSLIDLAGSERAADDKSRRTEGAHINKSLLTLGTVIARLSGDKDKSGNPTDKEGKHLPYRDSKLTRLLQGALSGGSLVSILCTIMIGAAGTSATSATHTAETLNTLKFASRAKNNIVSHAKKAIEALGSGSDAGSRVLLERYRLEIQNLKGQLETQAKTQSEKEELQLEREAELRREEQMLEMQLARTALKERIEHLNRLILTSQSTSVNGTGAASSSAALVATALGGRVSSRAASRSVRSSASHSSLHRTVSAASNATLAGRPSPALSPATALFAQNGAADDLDEDDLSGTASLQVQNQALQSDLADKTRYINTLEKRLLQARRSSHPRSSLALSSPSAGAVDREAEVLSLQAQIGDRDRTIAALRAMLASRDAPVTPVSPLGSGATIPTSTSHDGRSTSPVETIDTPPAAAIASSLTFPRHTTSSASFAQRRSSPAVETTADIAPVATTGVRDSNANRRSVDEMSRILDEMIQDRVERGEVVRSASKRIVRPATDRSRDSLGPVGVPSVEALVGGWRAEGRA